MINLTIDNNCIQCGQCVAVCPAQILKQKDKKAAIEVVNLQTCIKCGQCVAICPTDSVLHSAFTKEKVHKVNKELVASPESLLELLRRRRSNRAFSDKDIPADMLDKILEAASLAPTGGNRQMLEYTLVTKPEVLEAVHKATIEVCEKSMMQMRLSDDPDIRMRAAYFEPLVAKYKAGYEGVLRGAKALIIIHSNNPMAQVDANLAYQNASLMAEALGVAHFYTGFIRIFASMDTEGIISKAMGIKNPICAGMALSMPKYTFDKYVDRESQIVHRIV